MRSFARCLRITACIGAVIVLVCPIPGAADEETVEVVESFEVVTTGQSSGAAVVFGIPVYLLLRISGPIIWLAMVAAIVTRYMRIKGRARLLSTIHKACGYTAFGLGTVHGVVGLFL
jgi:hypothetical protein